MCTSCDVEPTGSTANKSLGSEASVSASCDFEYTGSTADKSLGLEPTIFDSSDVELASSSSQKEFSLESTLCFALSSDVQLIGSSDSQSLDFATLLFVGKYHAEFRESRCGRYLDFDTSAPVHASYDVKIFLSHDNKSLGFVSIVSATTRLASLLILPTTSLLFLLLLLVETNAQLVSLLTLPTTSLLVSRLLVSANTPLASLSTLPTIPLPRASVW